MKLKFLLLAAITLMVGSTMTVLVVQSNAQKAQLRKAQQSQLPAAISNYNQTFKLNTSPPLWPEKQKSGGTNGLSSK
jgi:flagellar basal body-associated protein FliL